MNKHSSANLPVAKVVLQTSGLNMIYRHGKVAVHALRDIELVVHEGEFVAIMGPSGCGKSTLLHLLGGLLKPTDGSICIDGVNIVKLKDRERTEIRREKIGYIFQRFNLLPTLTAEGNLILAKRIHGNGYLDEKEASEVLRLLGIQDKLDQRPIELSGGEQQRVAIARAVLNKPSIILADEPTGSLDSTNSKVVLRLLRETNHRLRQTIVMITHDPEAAHTAQRIVEMRDGMIISNNAGFYHEAELDGIF